jgi:hypothetical protein
MRPRRADQIAILNRTVDGEACRVCVPTVSVAGVPQICRPEAAPRSQRSKAD